VFYRKLHVLHISVVVLQNAAHFLELCKCFWELGFHFCDVHRGTNAGNYVFALCVGQEFAEQTLCTSSRVTGKGNTSTAVVAHVTECHALYVNSSTPRIRDIVITTIYVCSRVVPAAEYSLDGTHQLFLRIRREVCTDLFLIFSLELVCQFLQIVSSQFYVLCDASVRLHLIDELFKVLLADFHNNVGVHLDESSVAVPCPSRIAGLGCDGFYYFFVQTEVQDGIHHTRHGSPCTGTNGNEQRIFLVTELLAGDAFHLGDVLVDFSLNLRIDLTTVLIILCTSLCGDGEALRNRQTDVGHFGEVCTLTAEELSHVCVTFSKQITILFCHW